MFALLIAIATIDAHDNRAENPAVPFLVSVGFPKNEAEDFVALHRQKLPWDREARVLHRLREVYYDGRRADLPALRPFPRYKDFAKHAHLLRAFQTLPPQK